MVIMAADDRKTNYRKTEKNFLKISFQDAKKMSEKKYSCLEEVKHHMNVSISPKYIGNIRSGLKEEMDKFLFSHQPKLQGVPLAYEKIIIEQSKIIDDQEFINIDICVKLIVFQPKISKVLCGFVNKIGKITDRQGRSRCSIYHILFLYCVIQDFCLIRWLNT